MSTFFRDKDFILFKRVSSRMKYLNTDKNYKNYIRIKETCIQKAKNLYNNIGYREEENSYSWAKTDMGPRMIDLGDYKNGFSFYPGHHLYVTEDFNTWVLKQKETNEITVYSDEETDAFREKSIKELQKIHVIKKKFQGTVVNG